MMIGEQHFRNVLVTDGDQRASLAVVRSLGFAGNSVYVCSPNGRSIAGASRFARLDECVADALSSPKIFVDDVRAVVAKHKVDTIIPMTESSLLALLPERDQLPGVLLPFTDAATFRSISDKQAVLAAAQNAGIATPQQAVIGTRDAAQVFDMATVSFPVVVKPARSVSTGARGRLKLSVQHAASEAELRTIIDGIDERGYPLLLQQRVVGPGVGIFVLVWNAMH
jgi:predicted ATP-grasp superfamily ATP-dependent carboligase